MTAQTMEEMRADNIRAMGGELGAAFSSLEQNVIELHVVWKQYRELFCNDADVVALLNRTAGLLFKVVQDELWDSVLLGILRLTDKAGTAGRSNLTFKTLETIICEPELKESVVKLVEVAREKSNVARVHRDRRIAHLDYYYGMDRNSVLLNDINLHMVEEMLAAIRAVMHCLEAHFHKSQTIYERFVDTTGARQLVAKLIRYESFEKARANILED